MNLCFLGAAVSQDSDVAGKVLDAHGNPLAGVSVTGMHHFPAGGAIKHEGLTDDQGNFELKGVGRVIFFTAPKFEALTHIRGLQESSFEVALKPTVGGLQPAVCPNGEESGKRYGYWSLFLIPRGARVKRHNGDDTWDIDFYFPRSKTKEHANLWSGALMGNDLVEERLVLDASSFSQRGYDWRGKSREGKNWRWTSFYGNLVRYEDASDDAARFFDRVIDSVCVPRLASSHGVEGSLSRVP